MLVTLRKLQFSFCGGTWYDHTIERNAPMCLVLVNHLTNYLRNYGPGVCLTFNPLEELTGQNTFEQHLRHRLQQDISWALLLPLENGTIKEDGTIINGNCYCHFFILGLLDKTLQLDFRLRWIPSTDAFGLAGCRLEAYFPGKPLFF